MHCDNCGTPGFDPRTMTVDVTRDMFLGSCCSIAANHPQPNVMPVAKLEYHLELSSQNGLVAAAQYGPFRMQFQKSSEELSRWFRSNPVPMNSMMPFPRMM